MEHQYNNINICPICDCNDSKSYISAVDHNVSNDIFFITKCSKCGLKYTNPKPTEETIGNYYKNENYISHTGTKKGVINKIYHIVRIYQLKNKESLISKYGKEKKILDIGCGTGEFLNYCNKKGWETKGIEPDYKARCFGINNYKLTIEDADYINIFKHNYFSIITMWHVLEHVYHLKDYLNKIHSLLSKNGFLIVAVPNCESYDAKVYKEFWAAYDLPIHLYHFTKDDVINISQKTGFKLIDIKPLVFDSYYISMLSEKKKNGFFLNAILTGLLSNLKARKKKNYSSLIYILQKN